MKTMKKSIAIVFAVVLSAASLAQAADEKKLTPQQEKMKMCNAEAGEKKLEGDARKTFMSECLKATKVGTPQDKMKTCNKAATAKGLKGEDRKSFMSECLSGDKKS